MERAVVKIGDVFKVQVDEKSVCYLQYICDDLTQLNSEVIAVFKQRYELTEEPDLEEIVTGEVDFHAHTVIKQGVKLKVWSNAGNSSIINKTNPYFRMSEDDGNLSIKISKKWKIWEPNKNMKSVGVLKEQHQSYDIGCVIPAAWILEKLQQGSYQFVYPNY